MHHPGDASCQGLRESIRTAMTRPMHSCTSLGRDDGFSGQRHRRSLRTKPSHFGCRTSSARVLTKTQLRGVIVMAGPHMLTVDLAIVLSPVRRIIWYSHDHHFGRGKVCAKKLHRNTIVAVDIANGDVRRDYRQHDSRNSSTARASFCPRRRVISRNLRKSGLVVNSAKSVLALSAAPVID